MGSPIEYPEVDPSLRDWLRNCKPWVQVQYSTKDQLRFLVDLARKFGLYDAADWIEKGLKNELVVKESR